MWRWLPGFASGPSTMGSQQSQPQPTADDMRAAPHTINPQYLSAPRPTQQPTAYGPQAPPHTINPQHFYSPPQRNDIQPAVRQATHPFPPMPFPTNNGQYMASQGHNLTSNAGPTQTRKPKATTSEQNNVNANLPQSSAKALLDPRGVGGTPAAFQSTSSHNSTADQNGRLASTNPETANTEPGMSSMIERMHHVANRESAPSSKRKSEARHDDDEDSPERKKNKSTFNGAGKGGALSEHMKVEREKIAAEMGPPPAHAPIDLTADDDEVVFTGEKLSDQTKRDNEEIHYGSIMTKANISRLPAISQKVAGAVPKDFWPKTRLTMKHDDQSHGPRVELFDGRGRPCGNIAELKVASALIPMLAYQDSNKLRIKAYLQSHKRTASQVVGQNVSLSYLSIAVALFGPRKHATWLGTKLSQKQLFLTNPPISGVPISTMEVYNPHDVRHVYGPNALSGQRRPQGSQLVQSSGLTVEEIRRETDNMFDKLVKHEKLPEMEPKSGLILTPLMAHQKKALHFLIDHERAHEDDNVDRPGFSLWKPKLDARGRQTWYNVITGGEVLQKPEPVLGGILADMMGLGKTLNILTLIVETLSEARQFAASKPPVGQVCNAKATLITCPKSVLSNWSQQIEAHMKTNKVSCYIYHGASRTSDVEFLASHHIVLTTYNTAGAEFAAKGRPLGAINWFRIVLDEAHQIRNAATQVSKACCDLAAQRRWAVTGTPVQNGLGDLGALIKFLRIKPFDEGQGWAQHIISPLKMGDMDVVTKLRLLVDSITLRRLKDTINLHDRREVTVPLDFTPKNKKIYAPLAGGAGKQLALLSGGAKLKGKAYAHVLKSIGRLRAFCAHGLDMFNDEDRQEIVEGLNPENAIAIDLGDDPADEQYNFVTAKQAYETLHVLGESDADRCEKCNRKIGEKTSQIDREGALKLADDDDEESSSDDENDDTIGYLNPCYHIICTKCKDTYVTQSQATMTEDQRHNCPCCEAYIRFGLFQYHRSTLRNFIEERQANVKSRRNNKGRAARDTSLYEGPSEKVSALLDALRASAREYVPPGEPPIRSVVFTGWTTYLDLIEIALDDNDIGYVRLDGSMSVKQRSAVLETFKSDPAVTVILVSIKAGGQGLNLTAASKVYMMEPQFNPGVEQQAIDRVHRLGQTRDVHITHYIMNDSVEQGIVKLQKRKEDLADFTLQRKLSKLEEAKKRIENLKDLFK